MLLKFSFTKYIFNQFSRVSRHNSSFKEIQTCRWMCTIPKPKVIRGKEAMFIAQFVPQYIQKQKFLENQNIFTVEENYQQKTSDEICNVFEELSFYCEHANESLTDGKYDNIIDSLISKLPEMNDEQIVKILVDLYRFPLLDYKSQKYTELWNSLDDQCWERSKYWRWAQLLKVMNAWYQIGITKNSKFNHKALMKLSRKLDEIPPRVLVEMMFYQSLIRHKDVPMYYVESRLEKILDDLTIDEIGIVCLAFFKTESKLINGALLNRIYQRVSFNFLK